MNKLLIAFALGIAAVAAHAQDYPSKPVVITVPNPPGGMNQITAQPLSAVIEKLYSQPAPVINKPGGTAAVGTAFVAQQKPDGLNEDRLPGPGLAGEGGEARVELNLDGFDHRQIADAKRTQHVGGTSIVSYV